MQPAMHRSISRRRHRAQEEAVRLKKDLRTVALIASVAAISAGVLGYWDAFVGATPERTVTVYRIHGCRCVFPWADELRKHGFIVRVRELESLERVRDSLHTPASLHGCHVATYLGYFIEGHVGDRDLHRLATERPSLLGVAADDPTSPSSAVVVDRVVAFNAQGERTNW